jgi:hypothetical protein
LYWPEEYDKNEVINAVLLVDKLAPFVLFKLAPFEIDKGSGKQKRFSLF